MILRFPSKRVNAWLRLTGSFLPVLFELEGGLLQVMDNTTELNTSKTVHVEQVTHKEPAAFCTWWKITVHAQRTATFWAWGYYIKFSHKKNHQNLIPVHVFSETGKHPQNISIYGSPLHKKPLATSTGQQQHKKLSSGT